MTGGDVNLDHLAQVVREAGRPVHVNVLSRAAVRAWLEAGAATERRYAAGARYRAGETIRFDDQRATVQSVRAESNPVQGPFSVLTLVLPDGTERLMAADVPGAPAEDRAVVTAAQVDEALRARSIEARQAVRAALAADPRFVSCQTSQGDLWCLAEMLPPVAQADLQKAVAALPEELVDEELASCTTGELVDAAWGLEDDGGDAYARHAFALSRALSECEAVHCLGDRWASARAWTQFTARPALESPRVSTEVALPPGVEAASAAQVEREQRREAGGEGGEPADEASADEASEAEVAEAEVPAEQDIESWRQGRLTHAVFTLRACHYYEGWLPLSGQVRRLFPPLAAGRQEVVFHHHLGDEPGSFRAWVDREQGRVWVSPDVAETFRRCRIYPGARLRLSARSEREFDVAPRETDRTDPVRVWRTWLDEEGQIQYEDYEEPRRYDVDDDVYVADVRFEDLGALFRQAEEVGNSVFGLMYEQAVAWWETGGREDLLVTAGRLFEAIHPSEQGRMTSKATVAWELWRRLAFEPVGRGRYRFRPEFGDWVRRIGPAPRRLRKDEGRTTEDEDQAQVATPASSRRRRSPQPPSECWARVLKLTGRELYTLDQGRSFRVLEVDADALHIRVGSTDKPRPIRRQEIEPAWEHLVRAATITLADIRQYSEFSTTYVAAVLATFPDVAYRTRPIRLMYGPPSNGEGAEDVPSGPGLERTRSGQLVAADLVPPGPLFEEPPSPLRRLEAASAPGQPVVEEDASGLEGALEPSQGFGAQSDLEAELQQIQEIVRTSLVGETIYTLARHKPNRITEADQEGLTVATKRGVDRVRWEGIKEVYEELCRSGEIAIKDVQEGAFRSRAGFRVAFIFALLSQFAHIGVLKKPRIRLTYHRPEGSVRLRDAAHEAVTSMGANREPEPTEVLASPDAQPLPSSPLLSLPPLPPKGPGSSAAKRGDMQTKTLFSRHYLEHRLPDHPEWADDPRPAFEAVRGLWQQARQYGDAWNEAQTEEEFVKPVLGMLGWSFIVQPKAHSGGHASRPDYALFAGGAGREEAYPYQGDDDPFYSRVLAIAEAKYWGRPLSHKDQSGRNTWKVGANPSHQMVGYLVGTRVPWGILTNGRVWRLYSREVSSTASEFYEVDLGDLFDALPPGGEPGDVQLDRFRRWWLFFRRDAFLPDAQGRSFVQRVHEGSATYAREISDKLKELVFDQVMPEIAGGFVGYRYHELGVREETEESLRQVYQASLSLLYKLLFLLYAEARGLLPVDNPGYREQSLTALARWAAERLDKALPLSDATHATSRYGALLALFHRVDQGDPSLGVPRYNGGLFDPASPDNQFLERHRLSDRVVARAVDILVRDAGRPVDYAYISVRNMGAIYEGLLENRLRVVDAAAGRVELVNDKGERKATGSYYTPDYIVEYIVGHTLDPILAGRDGDFRAAMDRCAGLRRRLRRISDPAKVRLLRDQLRQAERDAREAFLGIKVCDPAMGSGHFLVNAVDHLTDGIIQRMQAYHDEHPSVPWEWNPIQRLIERVRVEILEEMARQEIVVDLDRLDDTALLTRLVMKRCIYGVDLNRMAVELAKLSLWLHSFTVGAPLSFLDHHLRWGNSLIGTGVRTVEQAVKMTETGQFGLFAGPFAGLLDLTGLMTEVAEQADATLADVRQSAETFDHFQQELTPYKQVLDLWVSQYFGNEAATELLTVYGADVLPALKGEKEVPDKYRDAIQRARELWREKRFFHWDLEFPEVFVDLARRDWAENPGFDAVVGNPPYSFGRDWGGIAEKSYYAHDYQAAQYQIDLYQLFMERGLRWTRESGFVSYIVPDTWTNAVYSERLRELYITQGEIVELLVLPSNVFHEATVDTIIYALRKRHPQGSHQIIVQEFNSVSGSANTLHSIAQSRFVTNPGMKVDFLISPSLSALLAAADKLSVCLNEICETTRGINAYDRSQGQSVELIKARTYHSDHRVDSSFSPELMGEDVGRFENKWNGQHWIKYGDWLAAPREERFFTQPKLLVRKLLSSGRIVSYVDTENFYVDQQLYIGLLKLDCSYNLHYLCTICNSYLMSFIFVNKNREVGVAFPQMTVTAFNVLSIRRIAFTTPPDERARLVGEGITEATEWIEHTEGKASSVSFSAFSASVFHRWLDARLSPTPHETRNTQHDAVHDLLAHLAQQMIEMNQEKQAEVKGFLAWLAREVGAPLDGLTGKSRLQNYLGDYQKGEAHLALDELLDVLRRNRRHLRVDPSARAFQERLAQEYEASLEKLLPLKARLAATDRLIDLIVYRLYGLTEAEVAVVEGKTS